MKRSVIQSFSRALNSFYLQAQNSCVDRMQQLKSTEVKKVFSNINVKNFRWLSSLSSVNLAPDPERIKIVFILPNGERVEADGDVGESVMSVAVRSEIGMEGACEGSLACTTCHGYMAKKFLNLVKPPVPKEEDLLDVAPFLKPNSRLCCQIKLSKDIEGCTFTLPRGTLNMAVDGHKPKKH